MWFFLEKNHEKVYRFPDFLQRSTGREPLCATFFEESRMRFGGSTNLYRKSGFGLHQLRNCFKILYDPKRELRIPPLRGMTSQTLVREL